MEGRGFVGNHSFTYTVCQRVGHCLVPIAPWGPISLCCFDSPITLVSLRISLVLST